MPYMELEGSWGMGEGGSERGFACGGSWLMIASILQIYADFVLLKTLKSCAA